jgi:hypothetical protein
MAAYTWTCIFQPKLQLQKAGFPSLCEYFRVSMCAGLSAKLIPLKDVPWGRHDYWYKPTDPLQASKIPIGARHCRCIVRVSIGTAVSRRFPDPRSRKRVEAHPYFSVNLADIREDLLDGYRYVQKKLNEDIRGAGRSDRLIDASRCSAFGWSAGAMCSIYLVCATSVARDPT